MSEKVLINWGSYDVDNFGDLLFPFLIEHFLGDKYSRIIHASPTGKSSRWSDSISTFTILEALTIENIVGLVIGGGNLISFTRSSSINYTENPELAQIVHPSFFYVPFILRAKYGIPFAFNHIGVAKPIPTEKENIIKTVMESASYISCRDKESALRLIRCGVTMPISVGLDSAINISQVFSSGHLHKFYLNKKVNEKYGIPNDKVLAIIHVKKRYFKNQNNELSLLISFLIKNSIHPVFIPFGMCHEDELLFNEPLFIRPDITVIRNPKLIMDMLSIISKSNYYIGSSLHGAIASLSYNNKIAIIADELESKFSKFSGFLAQVDLPECLFSSWQEAYSELNRSGLTMLKSISTSNINKIFNEGNTWNLIYQSLNEEKEAIINIPKDDAMSNSIRKFYFNFSDNF